MNRFEKTASASDRERGSALIVALLLIVVLTLVGFGLLSRSLLVNQIAGSERWSTASFYAADSGLSVAAARLRVNRLEGFSFDLDDLRGATGAEDFGDIQVDVEPLTQVGPERLAPGTQGGGGQGADAPALYYYFFRADTEARNDLTRTQRRVEAVLNIGPVPPLAPALPALPGGGGGTGGTGGTDGTGDTSGS